MPNLYILTIVFVFILMIISVAITGALVALLVYFGIYDPFVNERSPLISILGTLVFSALMGTLLTAIFGHRPLKPLHRIIDATQRVAGGDFSVRLEEKKAPPEIETLICSFNKMVEELGSIETLRSDFVSNFSHEFKTPIVSIRGFAKLLQDEDLPEEERREYTEIILQESERLAGLATNVLNLSKLENIGILTDKEYFFLDEQIRRVAALMEPRWKEKDITVSLHMDAVTICSSQELLQQVWVNLLDNAIKYTGEGGSISLSLKKSDASAVFTIEDNGCGMDEATCAHVFDKFYQADASHAGKGNGLGLPLVQRAVALCGGGIAVESHPGRGSRFTVTLPLE